MEALDLLGINEAVTKKEVYYSKEMLFQLWGYLNYQGINKK